MGALRAPRDRRATTRGAERTSLDGDHADVLICGASFAGLSVARELAGRGADVLLVDRYEVGERATSACAAPTPWLHAMGVADSIRQEIPCMSFHTPHGSVRYRLPWSWSAFDYRELCELLFAQTDARFETAKVDGRTGEIVHTDRGDLHSPLIVDALGWRRVLAREGYQPPEAPLSRGLEVHPRRRGRGPRRVDRPLARAPRLRLERARREASSASASARTSRATTSKEGTVELACRLDRDAVRYQGNWFPHRLRPAAEDGVFFVGDSAGHCFALSGEGIRTAFYFGIAVRPRAARACSPASARARRRCDRYGAFSARHARAFGLALRAPAADPGAAAARCSRSAARIRAPAR